MRLARSLWRVKMSFGSCPTTFSTPTFDTSQFSEYNILRKALPTAFANGIEGVVVRPVGLTLARSVQPGALATA